MATASPNLIFDPVDALKFGIRWNDALYVDGGVTFGWMHGSVSFQMVANAVVYIMFKAGCQVRAYIDDFLVVAPQNKADSYVRMLLELFDKLGLPKNPDKKTPCKSLICLGVEVNVINNTLKTAPEKLQVFTTCAYRYTKTNAFPEHLSSHCWESYFTSTRVSSLQGHRILMTFRANSHKNRIKLDQEFYKDIE